MSLQVKKMEFIAKGRMTSTNLSRRHKQVILIFNIIKTYLPMKKTSTATAQKMKELPRFSRIRPSSHPQDNQTLINALMETFTKEEISNISTGPVNAQPPAQTSFTLEQLLNMDDSFYVRPPPIFQSSLKKQLPQRTPSRQGMTRNSSASINADSKKRLESKMEQARCQLSSLQRSYESKKSEKQVILRESSLRKQLK